MEKWQETGKFSSGHKKYSKEIFNFFAILNRDVEKW
jgi:hypothetical protein